MGGHEHGDDQAHGGPKLYWIFCAVLCVFTFLEWLIFDMREPWGISSAVMVPLLSAMSLVKFIMVVGWYMHLKYDPKWMKTMFIFALAMGGGTAAVLHLLMA